MIIDIMNRIPMHVLTPWSLFEEQSILRAQASIFLENQLSKQAELSEQGEQYLKIVKQAGLKFEKQCPFILETEVIVK